MRRNNWDDGSSQIPEHNNEYPAGELPVPRSSNGGIGNEFERPRFPVRGKESQFELIKEIIDWNSGSVRIKLVWPRNLTGTSRIDICFFGLI